MGDWISSLPDEILFLIISKLAFESAIQTIFLSKRWRLLWETALVQHGTEEDAAQAICDFLANFNEQDPSKNTRKFQFHFINGSVVLAIIAPNNKLHLDFSSGKQEIHRQFKLQLEFNNPQNFACSCSQPSPSLSAFSVKSLHLISVNHLTNDAVSSMLKNFMFLETLKITGCNFLQSLSIGSDTKLLNLIIFDCLQLELLHIRSFKLRMFRFRGLLPSFWLEYHYNLADAFLDFRQGPKSNSFSSCDFDSVLLAIKNVKVLTLCKWTFQALICPSLSTFLAEFQFYNLEELWWIDNSEQEYDSDPLISFLKLCPSLERLFVTVSFFPRLMAHAMAFVDSNPNELIQKVQIDPKSYCVERAETCSIQAGRNTKLQRLKLVKLDGFTKEADETLLAEHLGEVVTSEPLILASADGICLRKLIHDPLYQPKQQSHERKCSYKSVEVKDMNMLCPKHVHMGL